MVRPNDSRALRKHEQLSHNGWWVVWRMDDNGNQFEIARFPSLEEAHKLAKEFESRGHKQTYWVSRKE
jgi:hypothetical protein